jgi:type I restriction enzyme S subunit
MKSGFEKRKLGELVTFTTGKLDSNAAVPDGDYPFFTCSQETLRTNTFSFDDECVLLAGNNATGIFPLKYFKGKFDAYQRTYVVRPRDVDLLTTKFLYYALWLKLDEFRSFSTGAATKFLTLTILNETEISAPPLSTQRRIASILSAYDDLIENCQRRIKILEAMARALYREWFVHFRFPGHQNHPRVASPLGEIPEGWEVAKLGDVAAVNRALINARSAPNELHYIDIASVSPGQIDSVTTYSFADAPGRARRVVQHGDVLWSCVRPNRRSFALVMRPEAGTIASTGFAVLTATKVPFAFLYFATTTDAFVAYLSNNATGAAYPAVTAPTFEKAELVIPGAALLNRFGELAKPMLEETHALQMKVQNLRRTRDLLLPRLLSGQIALDQLEVA